MIRQGAVYYFHNDQLGSPLKLTDSSQNVAWDGVRAPFGEMSVTTSSVENPLRFPGQYFDDETGLHQNWFRDYDPGLGRYIQSDPIGLQGGLNTYFYVNGNPLIYSDPLGLLPDWLEKAKKNRQKYTYTKHRTQRPKEHDDIFKPNKKRNKQKKEKRQLNDICKDYDIKDRNDFGEFLEE